MLFCPAATGPRRGAPFVAVLRPSLLYQRLWHAPWAIFHHTILTGCLPLSQGSGVQSLSFSGRSSRSHSPSGRGIGRSSWCNESTPWRMCRAPAWHNRLCMARVPPRRATPTPRGKACRHLRGFQLLLPVAATSWRRANPPRGRRSVPRSETALAGAAPVCAQSCVSLSSGHRRGTVGLSAAPPPNAVSLSPSGPTLTRRGAHSSTAPFFFFCFAQSPNSERSTSPGKQPRHVKRSGLSSARMRNTSDLIYPLSCALVRAAATR